VASARAAWREGQARMNPAQLVFIDETWATTNMTRLHGRCQRGKRLVAAVPHGHWRTSTFVAGLRTTGLSAPLVLDGAMNGDAFRAYVEQILAPTLAPGDVVIMDNLSSHKVAGVREAIEARGASLIYLPPYSPDLNPDRAVLRQAQGADPQSRAAQPRRSLECHRTVPRALRPARMRKLLRQSRLCAT